MVIILENGKRRAGKVHRSEITKGLVIQARSLEIILGALGKNQRMLLTVGNAMATFTTWKYTLTVEQKLDGRG